MKTAVIVLADGFEEVEAVTPIDLLRRAGVQVTVAALVGTQARGRSGISVVCDLSLDQVPAGWDALILPGGMPGAKNLAASRLVKSLLEKAFGENRWVGAICAAPAVVLGSQGFLSGRTFTGYPGTETSVSGARFTVEPVVVDGNLVTSRGVGTAGAFGLKLVEVLAGTEAATRVAAEVLLA